MRSHAKFDMLLAANRCDVVFPVRGRGEVEKLRVWELGRCANAGEEGASRHMVLASFVDAIEQ